MAIPIYYTYVFCLGQIHNRTVLLHNTQFNTNNASIFVCAPRSGYEVLLNSKLISQSKLNCHDDMPRYMRRTCWQYHRENCRVCTEANDLRINATINVLVARNKTHELSIESDAFHVRIEGAFDKRRRFWGQMRHRNDWLRLPTENISRVQMLIGQQYPPPNYVPDITKASVQLSDAVMSYFKQHEVFIYIVVIMLAVICIFNLILLHFASKQRPPPSHYAIYTSRNDNCKINDNYYSADDV